MAASLECNICNDICVRPQRLRPCGHTICQWCCDRWKEQCEASQLGFTCPECRTHIEGHDTDQDLNQLLLDGHHDKYCKRLDEIKMEERQRLMTSSDKNDSPFRNETLSLWGVFFPILISISVVLVAISLCFTKVVVCALVAFLVPFASRNQTWRMRYILFIGWLVEKLFWFLTNRPGFLNVCVFYVTTFVLIVTVFVVEINLDKDICEMLYHFGK